MNEKEIAFIICVNDENEFKEALNYIDALNVPEGYHTDVIAVREAPSMAAGYNAAMQSSNAKYKIYIHQDVFLIYKDLLKDLIFLFRSDEQIGMAGVLGCRALPGNAHVIARWDTGKVISNGIPNHTNGYEKIGEKQYSDVMALDGMFMATQYDIPWREDIFDGWDFYDISQSCEFIRAGKKVVVPWQREYWTMHDNRASNLKFYDLYRKKFIENYHDICQMKWEKNNFAAQEEYEAVKQETRQILMNMIDAGKIDQVCEIFTKTENQGHLVLREIELICKIYMGEKKMGGQTCLYHPGMLFQDVYSDFLQLRHLLQRIEFGYGDVELNFKEIEQKYSTYAVSVVIIAFAHNAKMLYQRLLELYKNSCNIKYGEFLKYQKIFETESHWEQGLEIVKDVNELQIKRKLVIISELTNETWKSVLKIHDKEDTCIMTESIDKNFDIGIVQQAMVLTGNAVKLVWQKQEKLYNDYCKVDIFGNDLEEYIKIFHNTSVPVVWHVKNGYHGTITYSNNITVV